MLLPFGDCSGGVHAPTHLDWWQVSMSCCGRTVVSVSWMVVRSRGCLQSLARDLLSPVSEQQWWTKFLYTQNLSASSSIATSLIDSSASPSAFLGSFDFIGSAWIIEGSLLCRSADEQFNSFLRAKVTYTQVPGTRSWTSLGSIYSAYHGSRLPYLFKESKEKDLLFHFRFFIIHLYIQIS